MANSITVSPDAPIIGDNIRAQVQGKLLIIVVDTSINLGPSSTGKTDMVATSHGFQPVPGLAGVSVSINIGRRANRR